MDNGPLWTEDWKVKRPLAVELQLNEPAPDFTLPADNNQEISLGQFRGNAPVLLFFYPGDFTPVCTREVCDFRDDFEKFEERGVQILGISGDSVEKHRKFADNCKLPFHLLSDENLKVASRYGARGLLGIVRRAYYLIDRNGNLVWQHAEVLPIFRLPNRTILQVIDRVIGPPPNGPSTQEPFPQTVNG
ncbi:MAG: peroxiredoxin [Candidatus Sumerlaeia bacterium]|nr:peroxiredoxin [Candidatus Sumerlaeia bacterium]